MDLFDLSGKVAVVTGGTRGIGFMISQGLLKAGASVYISSRRPDAGELAAAKLEPLGRVTSIPADLATEDECGRLANEVARCEDAVHILVNNAGMIWVSPMEEFPAQGWDRVLDLNLKAPFFLTRAFLPLLERGASDDDPARVINVGSVGGIMVPPAPTYSYAAAKAGLHHLTRVLAKELGARRITVNAIAPGTFDTKMMEPALRGDSQGFAAMSPLGRIGRAEDMAGIVIYLGSRAGAYVTGAVIPVDGGMSTTL